MLSFPAWGNAIFGVALGLEKLLAGDHLATAQLLAIVSCCQGSPL
jgi:hypothetical protein